MRFGIYLMAVFCLNGVAVTQSFALSAVKANDPNTSLKCLSQVGVLDCVETSNDVTIVIDPEKGATIAGFPDQAGVKTQLKSAIEKNELSRILLCVDPTSANFIRGIVLTSESDPAKVLQIKVLDGRQPNLLFPPYDVKPVGSDTELCNDSFK